MTRRPLVLCLLVAALVAAPTTARATPKDGGGTDPYRYASALEHVNCQDGAVCEVTSSATTAGALSGTSTYGREEVGDGQHEAGVAWVRHDLALPVPTGTTAVTVTATWSLDLKATAFSWSGTTYGAVSARMWFPDCMGARAPCTATLSPGSSERVRWFYDMPDGPASSGRDGQQTVTLSMKVEGSLPRQLTIHPDVQAAAGGYSDCVLLVPCTAGKEKPRGTSSASFTGTLQSVSLRVG